MTITAEKKEAQIIVREKEGARVLAPAVESLGKVGELRKGKEYNVRDSVGALHS